MKFFSAIVALVACVAIGREASPLAAQVPAFPRESYFIFVASTDADLVTLVRFGPKGALIEHRTSVAIDHDRVTGPRGVSVAPDGREYYVTTTRGFPTGELLKVKIAADSNPRVSQPPDTILGAEPLGVLPGAIELTPDGAYAWIANAGAVGDSAPSSISVVYLGPMVEVARIATCRMPLGSQLPADASKHYSVCLGDNLLIEIDIRTAGISRRLSLPGKDQRQCAPDALAVAADGARIYVACQQSNDVLEVNAGTWSVARQIPTGASPGAVALTHDGRTLIVGNRGAQTVSLIGLGGDSVPVTIEMPMAVSVLNGLLQLGPDAASVLGVLAQAPGIRMPGDIVISPDDRYAFVSVEGMADEPGTVEIIDLAAFKTVATIDVGRHASGIAFWKMERPK